MNKFKTTKHFFYKRFNSTNIYIYIYIYINLRTRPQILTTHTLATRIIENHQELCSSIGTF